MSTPALHILTGGDDKKISFLNVETGEKEHEVSQPEKIFHICQLSDEEFACTAYDHNITVWNYNTRTVRKLMSGHTENTKCLAFEPESNTLVTGSQDNTVRVWTMPEGDCQGTLSGHSSTVYAVEVCPSVAPLKCFSGSYDNSVRMWDYSTLEFIRQGENGHSNDVECLCRAPEEGLIFSGGDDNKCIFWDARELRKINEVTVSNSVYAVCFRLLKKQLCVGSRDGNVNIYDIRAGNDPLTTFSAHSSGDFWDLQDVINPDIFVTASWGDERTRAWDENGTMKWDYHTGSDMTGAIPFHVPFADAAAIRYGTTPTGDAKVHLSEERARFIAGSEQEWAAKYRFDVKFGDNIVRACKSFFIDTTEKFDVSSTSELVLEESDSKGMTMSPASLLRVLTGNLPGIDDREMVNCYQMCRCLGLKKHAYCVCLHVEALENPALLMYLCDASMKRFEKPEDDDDLDGEFADLEALMDEDEDESGEIQYAAAFTVACFNALKKHYEDIDTNIKLKRACVARNLLLPIQTHKPSVMKEHAEFKDTFTEENMPPRSIEDLVVGLLTSLHESKKLPNVTLVPEEGDEEFPAHLDILMSRCALFSKLMTDETAASTFCSTGRLTVPGTTDFVKYLLGYIYTHSLEELEDFKTLFHLFKVAVETDFASLEASAGYFMAKMARKLKRETALGPALSELSDFLSEDVMVARLRVALVENGRVVTAEELSELLGAPVLVPAETPTQPTSTTPTKSDPDPEESEGEVQEGSALDLLAKRIDSVREKSEAVIERITRLEAARS